MRLVTDTIEFGAQHLPRWNTVSISGYHIREAGSTAAQELAFTLADGFAYVEACLRRGLDIEDFVPRLSFFFNAHSNFLEEIAKFRAARRLWARTMRDRFGVTSIVISHDMAGALEIADHIYLLAKGEIAAHGTPSAARPAVTLCCWP